MKRNLLHSIRLFLLVALLCSFSRESEARLNETHEQCGIRYGGPLRTATEGEFVWNVYEVGGRDLGVVFVGGVSVAEVIFFPTEEAVDDDAKKAHVRTSFSFCYKILTDIYNFPENIAKGLSELRPSSNGVSSTVSTDKLVSMLLISELGNSYTLKSVFWIAATESIKESGPESGIDSFLGKMVFEEVYRGGANIQGF